MNNVPPSPFCEDQLLELLVEDRQASRDSHEHLASCPECRGQLASFRQQVDAARDFLAPSSLQMQRIRAKVWEKIEPESRRDPWWQPAWASTLVLGLFILLTMAAPFKLSRIAGPDLDGAALYASADSLEVMVDQLLPGTAASDPPWEQALSGGILEVENMEQIDNLLELLVSDRGEQT